jgi:hypothetical protein
MDTPKQLPDRRGGPATSEGRAIAKYNSTIHGFADRRVVIARLGESEEEYRALVDAFFDEYRPERATERQLVCELASNRWRLARAVRFESAQIEILLSQVENEKKDALVTVDCARAESQQRLDRARGVLDIVRSSEHEGTLSWENVPDSLWEDVLADLEPQMASLPARELGGVKTPEEVITTLRRELSLDDATILAELRRVADRNFAEAQKEFKESLASREAVERDYALKKEAASLPSENAWERIHRFTSSLEKDFRQKLEVLIKLQQIRRDREGDLVREIPPPVCVGGGAQDVPEIQA